MLEVSPAAAEVNDTFTPLAAVQLLPRSMPDLRSAAAELAPEDNTAALCGSMSGCSSGNDEPAGTTRAEDSFLHGGQAVQQADAADTVQAPLSPATNETAHLIVAAALVRQCIARGL